MFSEKDFSKLLSEVEEQFSAYLAKAETTLAKSEDDSAPKKEEKEDAKPEAKAEDKKEESQPEDKQEAAPEKSEDAPAAPEEKQEDAPAAPADEAAPADAAPAQEEGHGYDDEDMAHMQEMYASMSKAELLAHHDAVRAALDACGMQKCGDMTAEAAPMAKSEEDTVVEVKPEVVENSQETEMLKSEVAAKSAKIEELQKTLDAVSAFVTKLVEKKAAPAGKAITHLETIAKSEEVKEEKTFSKQEITNLLNAKASDTKLSKSDREAINNYYATGQINITGISHLLK